MMTMVRSEGAGSVIEVVVEPGDRVTDGDEVVVVESMKMEIPIVAPVAGTVSEVHVAIGNSIQENEVIVTISDSTADGAQ